MLRVCITQALGACGANVEVVDAPKPLSSASPLGAPVSREANASEHFIFQASVNNRRVSVTLRCFISSKYLKRSHFLRILQLHDSLFCLPQENEHAIALLYGRQRKGSLWIHDKFGCKCMRKENCRMLSEDFHFAQVLTPRPLPWYLIAIHFVVYIVALTSLWRVTLAYLFSRSHREITISV